MNNERIGFADLTAGTILGPLRLTISAAANERYWRSAGVDHPALERALYPPIAANLAVLCFGELCPEPVIQTRQYLRAHRLAEVGTELVTTGRVAERYEKRGRVYVDVETTVAVAATPEEPVWSSVVSFTPAVTLGAS